MKLSKTWFDPTESSFAEFVRSLENVKGTDPHLRNLLRHGFYKVSLPRTPKVSIIISTYDRVDLLRRHLGIIRSIIIPILSCADPLTTKEPMPTNGLILAGSAPL